MLIKKMRKTKNKKNNYDLCEEKKYKLKCKEIYHSEDPFEPKKIWAYCYYKRRKINNCGSCPYYGQLEITFDE